MLLFTAVANLANLANLPKLGRTVVPMRKPNFTPHSIVLSPSKSKQVSTQARTKVCERRCGFSNSMSGSARKNGSASLRN